ncbi:MAG TPA: ATP-binding protein [Chthoniobacterales bacterium]
MKSESSPSSAPEKGELPSWAAELALLYKSEAANQFLLCGNVADEFPLEDGRPSGGLEDFLLGALLPGFEVVLAYDLGNGLRVLKGGETFSKWRGAIENLEGRKIPRLAIETITHYLRYVANLGALGQKGPQVAVLVQSANLLAPASPHALNHELNAIALVMRDWSREEALRAAPVATFLVSENLSELHPLLADNPDAAAIQVPLPDAGMIAQILREAADDVTLGDFRGRETTLAEQLTGASVKAIRRLLKIRRRQQAPLVPGDIAGIKKALIESEGGDLIEFIEPSRTLEDFEGQPALKKWLRQDLELWNRGDLRAMPMGYLFCGPVGTGKTYAVECLAGEAGVPVIKLGNFRDRWVGSTEGNLERLFRLLRSVGRCFVFVDEADQTLGRRDSGSNDAGLSGRVYSMFAQEMSDRRNRGRIVWILASSRPDLIEVDLKRPGRLDVKIPIFPTATKRESFALLRALARRVDLAIAEDWFSKFEADVPTWLTPGAAEALALKLYRQVHAGGETLEAALATSLADYQPPVAEEIMKFQIGLAVAEATDAAFVPEVFRAGAGAP